MKYTDLTAVEDIDRDEMTKVVGGESWGEFNRGSIQDAGTGRAHLPAVLAYEEANDVRNIGQVIQDLRTVPNGGGLPGNNATKSAVSVVFSVSVDIPPGLQ